MARRKQTGMSLPAPFLRGVRLMAERLPAPLSYPFDLPWLRNGFELEFDRPVTIIIGENGTGKSTLIEALAGLSGFDAAGGGNGYRPVDHSTALAANGSALGDALRASWLPKVTAGWFFRAETFYSVARYLDDAGPGGPDFLSYSHGEGFVRFFNERMARQGIYFLDEPESALSPARQVDLLRFLAQLQAAGDRQVIMATHSPLLMALPGAALLQVTRHGLDPVDLRDTPHFQLYSDFTADPKGFVVEALAERPSEPPASPEE